MNSLYNAIAPTTNSVINDLSRLCQSDKSDSLRSLRPFAAAPVLKFKYVIIRAQDVETAIIVPPFAQHNWGINLAARTPISAGFAWRDSDGKVHAEGESDSLQLKSRPEDAEVIRETLFMNGL